MVPTTLSQPSSRQRICNVGAVFLQEQAYTLSHAVVWNFTLQLKSLFVQEIFVVGTIYCQKQQQNLEMNVHPDFFFYLMYRNTWPVGISWTSLSHCVEHRQVCSV